MCVMESKHQDPNVYSIKPQDGKGLIHMVILHSQGDADCMDQDPDAKLPLY